MLRQKNMNLEKWKNIKEIEMGDECKEMRFVEDDKLVL